MSRDEALRKLAKSRIDFADAIARLRDDEAAQLQGIKQMLVDLMDATEQTPTEDYVIAAYEAIEDRGKRRCLG